MTDAPLPPPPASRGTARPTVESTPPALDPPRNRAALFVGVGVAVALIAGIVTFGLSSRGASEDGRPTAVSLAFAKGDTARYRILMHVDASVNLGAMGEQPLNVDVSETVAWRVVSVDEDGVATVEVEVEELEGSVNGVDSPSGIAGEKLTFQVTPDGRIVSTTGMAFGATAGSGLGGFPGMDQMTPILPDGEIEPGDSWNKEFSQDFPFGSGSLEYTAHSTLERYETIEGVEAAVISTRYAVPIDFTVDFGDLVEAFGRATSKQTDQLARLAITYGGGGEFAQRAWVDLDGREVLRSTADGSFDMTIGVKGAPDEIDDFPLDGVTLKGTFRAELERL